MIITKKHVPNDFGTLLKDKMDSAKVSMTGLGKVVGVHRTTISDYILGKHLPKEETFHRIHQVFPDKDLYDAYFRVVKNNEPRKNKQMIPGAETYNYYEAKNETISKENDSNSTAPVVLSTLDKEYIAKALKYTIDSFEKAGMREVAAVEYSIYKTIYNKFRK